VAYKFRVVRERPLLAKRPFGGISVAEGPTPDMQRRIVDRVEPKILFLCVPKTLSELMK
jgi:hypothetical protein